MDVQDNGEQVILCAFPLTKLPVQSQHVGEYEADEQHWNISKYHQLIREKKELMRSWEMIRNRLNLIKHEQQKLLRRRCLDEKKKQYISKYRCSDTQQIQHKQSIDKRARSHHNEVKVVPSMPQKINKEAHLKSLASRFEDNRIKACQIKSQKVFFGKFVEQRKQLQMQRKLETAQSVRRHKLQLRMSKQRVMELKKQRIMDDIYSKIKREQKQCASLSRQLKKANTESFSLTNFQLNDMAHLPTTQSNLDPPKMLFRRIL